MNFKRDTEREEYLKQLFKMQQTLISYEREGNFDEKRKNYGSKQYYSKDLDGEIWKEYPKNSRYLVSNKGRIKFDGKLQLQEDEINPKTNLPRGGYLKLVDKNLCQDYVYNFVAYTFLNKIEKDGYHVHHITNDGYDNSVDNLVLLNQVEHSIVHCFQIGKF